MNKLLVDDRGWVAMKGLYLFILVLSSVQSLSHVWLFASPWTAACQASLSITSSQSLFKLMSIESVMPSNHLILCYPLLLPPSIFPSIRVFSNESVLLLENSFDTTDQSTVLKIMLYILEMPLIGRKSMLFTYFQLTISLGSQSIWILSPREVVLAPPPHRGPRKKIHLQYWPCKAKSKCCLKRETYGFFFPKKYIPPYLMASSIIPQL